MLDTSTNVSEKFCLSKPIILFTILLFFQKLQTFFKLSSYVIVLLCVTTVTALPISSKVNQLEKEQFVTTVFANQRTN